MKKQIFIILLAICCFATLFASCQSEPLTGGTEIGEPSALPETSSAIMETEPTPSAPDSTTKEDNKVVYEAVLNPVMASGADPWVFHHEGEYYYCYAEGTTVSISKFDDLNKMSTDNRKVVYTAPQGTAYSSNYWAPELHYLQGEWYIYVAADDGNNVNHRMYVLKGTTQNPQDPFEMVGKITDSTNKWAIDGTVLEHNGELYFIWSGWEGNENVAQNIYIAHMSDPCTIDSERVLLSTPKYAWERQGTPYVNEGPTALTHEDDVFLIYSASGSWTDNYCLGMLTLVGDDPMNSEHWEKAKNPVFKKKSNIAYGPGHCSFAPASDGSIWMIYHANLVSGSGWGGRSIWLAPVTFAEDGKPNFGIPSKKVDYPLVSDNVG